MLGETPGGKAAPYRVAVCKALEETRSVWFECPEWAESRPGEAARVEHQGLE